MARRSDIDWEVIERDYRCGQLSMRQIADHHKVALSGITRKAKKLGWSRDLSAEVKTLTKAKLIEDAVANAHAIGTECARTIISGVEAAANVNIEVIRGHRKDIRTDADRGERLGGKLDAMIDFVADPKDVATAIAAYESLVRSRAKLIAMEREAFGIDGSKDKAESGIESVIKRVMAKNNE